MYKVININGIIGEDFFATDIIRQIPKSNNPLIVNIDSAGGSVVEALKINAALQEYKGPLITIGQSLVGSAATLIYGLGKERYAYSNTDFFFHNPKIDIQYLSSDQDDNMLSGDELIKHGIDLKKVESILTNIYKDVFKDSTIKDISEMMDKETFLTTNQAYQIGFVTKTIGKNFYKKKKENTNNSINKVNKLIRREIMSKKNSPLLGLFAKYVKNDASKFYKNVMLPLEDGVEVYIKDGEEGDLVGKEIFLADQETPAPDGVFKLQDGRVITIVDGIITDVTEEVEEMEDKIEEQDMVIPEIIESLKNKTSKIDAKLNLILNQLTKNKEFQSELIQATSSEINNIKNEIKGTYRAPSSDFLTTKRNDSSIDFSRKLDQRLLGKKK